MADFNKYFKGAEQAGGLSGDDLSNVAGGVLIPVEDWEESIEAEGGTLSTQVRSKADGTGFYKYNNRDQNGIKKSYMVKLVLVGDEWYADVN